MNNKSVRKLTIAGLLVAVAVVGSLFSIRYWVPSALPCSTWSMCSRRCCSDRGMRAAWALPPRCCATCSAWAACLAFPGSMIGALLCGLLYRAWPKLPGCLCGRGVWHGHSGRHGVLSDRSGADEQLGRSALYLCAVFPGFHRGGRGDLGLCAGGAQADTCVSQVEGALR